VTRARLVGTTVLAVLLLGPLLVVLGQRVPDRISHSLVNDRVTSHATPVELVTTTGPEVTRVVPLWRVGPGDVSGAESMDLLLATWATTPEITRAELRVGTCRFHLPAATIAGDGRYLTLHRLQPCEDAHSASAELELTVRGEARVGWWTWEMPVADAPEYHGLTLTAPDAGVSTRSVVRGRIAVTRPTEGPRRVMVLAWLWDDQPVRIAGVWWAGIVLLLVGGLWMATGGTAAPGQTALGLGGVALALGLCWSLVIPPLQGADEPDHLLSVGEIVDTTHVDATLPAFAQRVHFERIRGHRSEQFTPADRDTPFPVPWTGDIHSEPMAQRSPVAAALWRVSAFTWVPGWSTAPMSDMLWRMRAFNAVVFAVILGLCALVVVRTTDDTAGAWLLAGVAFMPTLPYFATMLSDWAFLASWSVLAGTALIVLTHGRTGSQWVGGLLGVAVALQLGTSISSMTALPLMLAAVAGYLVIGGDTRRPLVFWGGMLVGALLAWWVLADLMALGYHRYDAAGRASFQQLLDLVNRSLASVAGAPWLLLMVGVAGLGVDILLRPVRRRAGLRRVGARVMVWVSALVAATVVAQLAWSVVLPMPQLQTLEAQPATSVGDYVVRAATTLFTAARLQQFDHLTFASLWGGFGWVDAMLPAPLLLIVVLLLVASLVSAWWHGTSRARAFTMVLLAGAMVSAIVLFVATAMMHRNLHGRYLLPIAIPATLVVGAALGHAIATRPHLAWRWGTAIILATLHGLSLAWVVLRYI